MYKGTTMQCVLRGVVVLLAFTGSTLLVGSPTMQLGSTQQGMPGVPLASEARQIKSSWLGTGIRNKTASLGTIGLVVLLLDRIVRKEKSVLTTIQHKLGSALLPEKVKTYWQKFKDFIEIPNAGTVFTALLSFVLLHKLLEDPVFKEEVLNGRRILPTRNDLVVYNAATIRYRGKINKLLYALGESMSFANTRFKNAFRFCWEMPENEDEY